MNGLRIESCATLDHPGWLDLREALWPHASRDAHLAEMETFLGEPRRYAQFVASANGIAAGLIEVSIRRDHVVGTDTSPVGFLEGIYVAPGHRRQGIARRMVATAELWVRAQGCSEFASDALIGNHDSHAMHRALGFEETERVVYFRRRLEH